MIDTVKELLENQYAAALCTLGICIDSCPEACWDVKVGKGPFQWVAFHTLFFTDYYLGKNEDGFQDQSFHLNNVEHFGDYIELKWQPPITQFSKPFIEEYLQHCRQKVLAIMQQESVDSLSAVCEFPRKKFSRAELHVYNIRHIQHHAAHLSLRLKLEKSISIPWVGSGWQ